MEQLFEEGIVMEHVGRGMRVLVRARGEARQADLKLGDDSIGMAFEASVGEALGDGAVARPTDALAISAQEVDGHARVDAEVARPLLVQSVEDLLDEVFVDAVREARVEEVVEGELVVAIRVERREELADLRLEIRRNGAVMEPRDLSELFECNQRHFFFSLRSIGSFEIVSLSRSIRDTDRSLSFVSFFISIYLSIYLSLIKSSKGLDQFVTGDSQAISTLLHHHHHHHHHHLLLLLHPKILHIWH